MGLEAQVQEDPEQKHGRGSPRPVPRLVSGVHGPSSGFGVSASFHLSLFPSPR